MVILPYLEVEMWDIAIVQQKYAKVQNSVIQYKKSTN